METAVPEPPQRSALPLWLRGVLGAVLILALLAFFLLSWFRQALEPVSETGAPQEFEVEPGWGAAQVSSALEQAGLVRNARVFSLYLQLENLDRDLGEGLYALSPSLSAPELAQRLAGGGRPRTRPVTLPEGFRAAQVVARLRSDLGIDIAPLVKQPGRLKPQYVPQGRGLEGYLFPARYDIPLGSTPEGVLSLMLQRFERELTPQVRRELQTLGLSVYDWVTLASMVQAEAGSYEEMPIIAGVFLNRLELGMRLQSDPTVAYGLGKRLPELDALAGDIDRDTPWNTYTRAGLPRTPIGNPGGHALSVIFQAQRTDAEGQPYLYFLHGNDGIFRPNLTLENHNRDVETYLR